MGTPRRAGACLVCPHTQTFHPPTPAPLPNHPPFRCPPSWNPTPASPCRLVIFTLYWKVGKNLDSDNITNIAAVLFMWTTLPAFGAASYVPAIVMERALFVRRVAGWYWVPA